MKIIIGTDHAGFELKEELARFLAELGHEVEDMGAYILDGSDDYPDSIGRVARVIAADTSARGVILGGSGQGEAIAANRVHGVRAAVYYGGPIEIVRLSRAHNDANVLSFGARFISTEEAKEALTVWLHEPFTGEERHVRRIQEIDALA
ncbi:MAG: ribose-5-phosphate isomerase [Candidatus Yonathbacteria bacterium RIFCSPHIGHO2_01_FULL_51_10]|uniref:Ribose-5-phosphate isomerase n=1 Tax=Candidatus Yonathbacteria bacterium RIFCSPHIGHO2_01_FULL_51_10 TaxID=1802723 RepID=A0A1G2S4T5_9BACT|nr:MAG: ribose-5-phosphate isomerase [Candidatus Yonathbacteria bacterium RIFCSPHIGHO2_01_FULL_51_10]